MEDLEYVSMRKAIIESRKGFYATIRDSFGNEIDYKEYMWKLLDTVTTLTDSAKELTKVLDEGRETDRKLEEAYEDHIRLLKEQIELLKN
jgi:hypothetical protein